MTNEILFSIFLLGGLGAGLGASYVGKAYVYAVILAITIYINIAEAKVIEVFGFATTLGTALFGVLYFCTDLLSERYGKKAAFTAVKMGIIATVLFHLFMQLTLQAQVLPDDPGSTFFADFSNGLDNVFTVSLRIVLASLVVYGVIQTLDIYIFDKIKQATNGKYLWVRNNGSTIVSQGLDTVLFTFLAFYGDIPTEIIWQMVAVGFGFKVIVAFADTGFIYVNRSFTPRDLKELKS